MTGYPSHILLSIPFFYLTYLKKRMMAYHFYRSLLSPSFFIMSGERGLVFLLMIFFFSLPILPQTSQRGKMTVYHSYRSLIFPFLVSFNQSPF